MKTKFKAKRLDGKGWVEGEAVVGEWMLKGCADYSDEFWQPEYWNQIIPETVCIGVEINGKLVYEGDIHMEKDGDGNDCRLPIVFENGAMRIDFSFDKDGSYLELLSDYEVPLNIIGNIHD